MYDVDGNGVIDLIEMTKIVKSIYNMMGPNQVMLQVGYTIAMWALISALLLAWLCQQLQTVVYFDQWMHASACIHMVENNEKHSKIMKKYLFHHAQEKLM